MVFRYLWEIFFHIFKRTLFRALLMGVLYVGDYDSFNMLTIVCPLFTEQNIGT